MKNSGNKYRIVYKESAKKDVLKLDKVIIRRLNESIGRKLTVRPHFFGKHLKDCPENYMVLRVGAYRVIYKVEMDIVRIFRIGHRSAIYKYL